MESVADDRQVLVNFLEEAELQQYHELFREILKVTKLSQLKYVLTEDLAHIGLSKPEQRRYKKIYSKYFPKSYISKIRNMIFTQNRRNELHIQSPNALPIDVPWLSENSFNVCTKHIISKDDISINKELGMGQFGVVQQGIWTTGNQRLQVAIKCLGQERMTSDSTEFLKEAAVMHSIEHPFIVRLYGVVLDVDSLMLVTELAPMRSLLDCLREVYLRPDFPVSTQCQFAEQICSGMTYLEQKRLIHRDLAARNILVFNKDRVKISDFGLSRGLGAGKDYYQTNYNVNLKLPVAWCAPECILFLRFTSASDVWAFAVCLWEMFTYGFQPWVALTGQQILEAIDTPNCQRLERPELCPENYYDAMMECWSQNPHDRPKFKDLINKLRSIRPEQVQATQNFQKPDDARSRLNYLEYKTGQIITVLGKNHNNTSLWYGVTQGGACGVFDPNFTIKGKAKSILTFHPQNPSSIQKQLPNQVRSSTRTPNSTFQRGDVKRHTTGRRTLQRAMISSPQGDLKHMAHLGLNGSSFGEVPLLDPTTFSTRHAVVSPYKPSEDLENQPLLNPNSPSHLTGANSTSPYPLLTSEAADKLVNLPGNQPSTSRGAIKKIHTETTRSKSLLSKVKKSATRFKSEDNTQSRDGEVHEYHEISDSADSDMESHRDSEPVESAEELGETMRNGTDFSQILLQEMESIFKNLDARDPDDESNTGTNSVPARFDMDSRLRTLMKPDKKKNSSKKDDCKGHNTMKPMSSHDEKTLKAAVALATEISTRSMSDCNIEAHKSKFQFKFPSLHLHDKTQDVADGKESIVKSVRRNFSEEAKSVPDIQETLTEESKAAYASLIEQPVLVSTMIPDIAQKEMASMTRPISATMPRISSKTNDGRSSRNPLNPRIVIEPDSVSYHVKTPSTKLDPLNELPLPPRSNKSKLVDKPRHVRKYPLIQAPTRPTTMKPTGTIPKSSSIYQNTCHMDIARKEPKVQYQNLDQGVDVFDGVDTNPFKERGNPFDNLLEGQKSKPGTSAQYYEGCLVKDCTEHVSHEDLLEFADQKPCGRQRGVESDEVRVMVKVLNNQVSSQECLDALELCQWIVHDAIKIETVKLLVGSDVTLEACVHALSEASGDEQRAAQILVKKRTE